MKAVIYARYSSDKQTEQSIEGQLAVCREYANRNNIEIVGEYIDRAISGRTDNRPDFQRMLADAAKKQWDAVIVYKGDRFARNRIESAINKNRLKECGVRLLSATENIPDTPEGIILESLLEGMAEYYSAELSQKVKRGIAESRKKGQMTGGRTPIGYSVSGKKYVINEEEAEIVKIIFTEYVNGTSAKEILNRLKAEGRTMGNGKPVGMHTIYNVAHRQIYAGDQIHPAIIPKELWQRATTVHEAQKNDRVRVKTSRRYPLSGKVFCGSCGSKYTASEGNGKGGNYLYYKCSDKMRKRAECHSKAIRKELLEDIVFDACCEILEGDFIKTVVDRAISISERKDKSDATTRLKDALRENERGIENILTAIEQGIITPTTKERLVSLENEAQAIREQLRTEQNKKSTSKTELTKFLSGLVSDKSDSDEFRETVFQLLVRSVIVFPDFIRITFHYSPTDGKDIPIDEIKEAIQEFDIIDKSTTKCDGCQTNTVFFTPVFFGIWVKR